MNTARASDIRLGVRIEVITVIWMVIEMAVSIGAGLAARSVLLTAFGVDSLIELVSGSFLLWRLAIESRGGELERFEQAEHRATWATAICLGLLCLYVLIASFFGLLARQKPENSILGIGVATAALLIMPYLAITKKSISKRIDSPALAGDAANSITCATMAGIVLAGLALYNLFGWWWVEYIAALIFLIWLVRETLEIFEEVREKKTEA